MMRLNAFAMLLATCAVLGCKPRAPASASPAASLEVPPPVVVTLDGPATPLPGRTSLTATIHAPTAPGIPARIRLVLPPGVVLVEGAVEETTTLAGKDLSRRFVVESAEVPGQDVVVMVDARADSWGAHATAAYRFGRPAPRVVPPVRSGPRIQVGGRDLGRAIPLDGR